MLTILLSYLLNRPDFNPLNVQETFEGSNVWTVEIEPGDIKNGASFHRVTFAYEGQAPTQVQVRLIGGTPDATRIDQLQADGYGFIQACEEITWMGTEGQLTVPYQDAPTCSFQAGYSNTPAKIQVGLAGGEDVVRYEVVIR